MQAVSMHCMYSVKRAEYVDGLHDMHTKGSGTQKQKMKCTSCKLLYMQRNLKILYIYKQGVQEVLWCTISRL